MPLKKIFIFSAGPGSREILRLIEAINNKTPTWEVLGYVDDNRELAGKKVDNCLVYRPEDLPVSDNYYGICGVMDPALRKKIVETEIEAKGYMLPALIHPTTAKPDDFFAGDGSVILPGVCASYNIRLGKSVLVCPNVILGHDLIAQDYASIMTSSVINGRCRIAQGCIVGAGAVLYQGVKVGRGSIVGMGTIVIEDIPENKSVVDFPRKIIRDKV